MKQIFIIKLATVNKEEGMTSKTIWKNCYAVDNYKQATKECMELQKKADKRYSECSYKTIYIVEEIKLY